jgi:hypothetical protein
MSAGYVRQARRNRETGTRIEVLDLTDPSSEFDVDNGNRWATVCWEHGFICAHPTLVLARVHACEPSGWCAACQASLVEAPR